MCLITGQHMRRAAATVSSSFKNRKSGRKNFRQIIIFIAASASTLTVTAMSHVAQVKTLSDRIASSLDEIRVLAGKLHVPVIVHELPELKIRFMSDIALRLLDREWSDIEPMSFSDFEQLFLNVEDSKEVSAKVRDLLAAGDREFISYFQQVRTSRTTEWHWYLSVSGVLLRNDEGVPILMVTVAMQVDPDHYFTAKASRLLDENAFLKRNFEKFATLSAREKDVLRLMVLGKTAGEIGGLLFISPATVETHRKRIYQKLGTNNTYQLMRYAYAFDLVKSSGELDVVI
jgi:Response regulator containing a CheY-like receiver domain and an HTH DNA-binding domain